MQKRNTGPNALRRGRFSAAGGNYFLTLCIEPRLPILTGNIAVRILRECSQMDVDGTWTLRCMTVMPDHVHLFITLGERLTLSQSVARLKAKTKELLPHPAVWQDNFYDHKIRPDDSVEAVIRYIFHNPHRAGLMMTHETWPHFYCRPDDWSWFDKFTDEGKPFPEWLM